jgi:hypothetical protein
MKNKNFNNQNKLAYFALILVLTFLVYKQSTGLNMLIISLLSVGYLSYSTLVIKNKNWWISAVLWIGSGLSLFLSHTYLGGLLFFLTGFNFISVNYNSNYSFPFSIAHTFFSTMLGIEKFMTPTKKPIQTNNNEAKIEEKNISYKYLKPIFIYGIPFILVIIFLKLYQLANPKFEEYTQFLSLEFIEWSFIGIYALLSIFLYGIYIYNSHKTSEGWDLSRENSINSNYTDTFQTKIGVETEQKMASILLVTLNLLLIAFLCIDGITLFSANIDAELTHSQNVHQGINVLITSILLVILIVGFMYRGSLNFTKNKTNIYLTISWLVLNIIMTVFNSFKNFNYINEWGLTHKRIGVFIYLGLCIIGLVLTLYKVLKTKSFVFLIRRVSFSFVTLLVAYSVVNWNHIIITYNLNETHFNTSKMDLHYNYSLGYSTYPELITFLKSHPKADEYLLKKLDYKINYIKNNVKTDWKDTPSLKWFDYKAKQKLQNYTPLLNNDYKETSTWYD